MIDLNRNFSGKIKVSKSKSKRRLYKHQEECIKELNKTRKLNKYKALLVIPTGGGKTFTSVYWILNEMINSNKKVLWLAHRHELLNQTIKTVFSSSFSDIVPNKKEISYRVISGQHDRAVNIKASDDLIIASKDSLTSNLSYLDSWIEKNKNNICIIVDEAHHSVASTYRKIINYIENESDRWFRLIGLTATPIRTDKNEKGLLGKIYTDGICYSVNLKTLINRGILSRPIFRELNTKTMINSELSASDIASINSGWNLPENIAKEIALHKNRNNYIVNEYINNKKNYGKTLVFAINIDHAIALNALFNEKGIKSDFVVSNIRDMITNTVISSEENTRKIKEFREGSLEVLINVNILTEGTDIPNIETIFLTRPTTSEILLNQMIGRGLRGVNAGGTKEANIVSFIDDWRYKINWVNPKDLKSFGEFTKTKNNRESLKMSLIPIKLIEEFTKLMDKNVSRRFKYSNYLDMVPLGSYNFSIFDDEDIEKNCEVLVFNHLEKPYSDFVLNLSYMWEKFNIKELTNSDMGKLYSYVITEIFRGYDLTIGFNERDIKDILRYYAYTFDIPEYISFEGRENYDISVIAREIINSNDEDRIIKEKWEDEKLGWRIYFADDFKFFKNEIYRVVEDIKSNKIIEKPKVISTLKYEELSMGQIRNIDEKYFIELRDAVYDKARDKDGNYVCKLTGYKNKNRRFFNIDHIVPISKGGKTKLDNLRVITRWANVLIGNKLDSEIDMQELKKISSEYEERIDNLTKLDKDTKREISKEILNKDKTKNNYNIKNTLKEFYNEDQNDIEYLLLRGEVYLKEEKFNGALICANKALKINPNSEEGLKLRGLAYLGKDNKNKALDILSHYIEFKRDDFEILRILGITNFRKNRLNLAVGYLSKALEIEEDFECREILAKAYVRKKKISEAIRILDEGISKGVDINRYNEEKEKILNL